MHTYLQYGLVATLFVNRQEGCPVARGMHVPITHTHLSFHFPLYWRTEREDML